MTQPTSQHNSTKTSGRRARSRTPRFRLQERDVAMVDAVHRHRVLSTAQIAALFFPSLSVTVSTACRARLRHLTIAGFLAREEELQARSEGRRPFLYMLTSAGRDLLMSELGYAPEQLDWKPSYRDVKWPFLRHQLDINDAYVAFELCARHIGWRIERWVDDRMLKKQQTERVTIRVGEKTQDVVVVPDAYFVLAYGETRLHFFLELDRATMSVTAASQRTRSWQHRIQAYQAFFRSRLATVHYQTDKIRVVTVTTGGGRRGLNLIQATLEVLGGRDGRYWFTGMEALQSGCALVEPIWHVVGHEGRHALLQRP